MIINYDSSFINYTINSLISNLSKKMDEYLIEGLKRKGFEFNNKLELQNFLKNKCRCEDNITFKQRIYFVNNIPFLLHNYKIETGLSEITINNETKITANYGTFCYL